MTEEERTKLVAKVLTQEFKLFGRPVTVTINWPEGMDPELSQDFENLLRNLA